MIARLITHARHQLLQFTDAQAAAKLRQMGSRFFHASASLQHHALGDVKWRSAYTFALVRNPFARQVSMFFFLLQEASCNRPKGTRPAHCEERRLPAPGPWLHDKQASIAAFRKWIREIAHAFPADSKDGAHAEPTRALRQSDSSSSPLPWLATHSPCGAFRSLSSGSPSLWLAIPRQRDRPMVQRVSGFVARRRVGQADGQRRHQARRTRGTLAAAAGEHLWP